MGTEHVGALVHLGANVLQVRADHVDGVGDQRQHLPGRAVHGVAGTRDVDAFRTVIEGMLPCAMRVNVHIARGDQLPGASMMAVSSAGSRPMERHADSNASSSVPVATMTPSAAVSQNDPGRRTHPPCGHRERRRDPPRPSAHQSPARRSVLVIESYCPTSLYVIRAR